MSWDLLREARERAGMTQAEVARALRITQSAVAQMERPGSNPTIKTLSTALAVTGHSLTLDTTPLANMVDAAQIARNLELSPKERIDALRAAYRKKQR